MDRNHLGACTRRVGIATLVLLGLAACGAAPAAPRPTATPAPSGITGQVLQGPRCPGPTRREQPCPDRPLAATLAILDPDRQLVTQVRSDAQGHFRVRLPPGTYRLVPRSPGGLSHAPEQTVVVRAGAVTPITVTYDTGMR